jgi:hypothetical protein
MQNDNWVDRELADCAFKDERLGQRFRLLLKQLAAHPGESIPLVCQDWANTKAAYRFLDNGRVSEAEILAGHFQATQDRCAATNGPLLVLHDTTEFSYKRDNNIHAVGMTRKMTAGAYRDGAIRYYTACGILMHSSLVVTTEGLPLGLAAAKFWTRDKFKGTNALKKTINPTRVPIAEKESIRWLQNLTHSTALLNAPQRCVHIGDRESDIYELFCQAQAAGTHFLIRTCVDRLAGDGGHTIAAEMKEVHCKGLHRIEVRDQHGETAAAVLELKYRRVRVLPPIGKKSKYPALTLTILHATERNATPGRAKVEWKLITDLPVTSRAQAVEKLHWYALRWKIETFHKILKSGCKVEESKLRAAERLVNLIATFCIVGWRIFWMTMINRSVSSGSPHLALTSLEVELLDRLVKDKRSRQAQPTNLSRYLVKIAQLGGYLARANDPPPGNTVIWRGLARLNDIQLGFSIGAELVGN